MKIVVVLFSLFAFGIAYGSTSLVLPTPMSPGMETSAVLPLPEMSSNKTQRLTISVDAVNVATNQLEIWFCNDVLGSREARDCLIGFDEGCLIEGRDTVASVEAQENIFPVQNIAFTAMLRSKTNPFHTKADLIINGVTYPISFQSPHLLRSLRVVSRGLDDPQARLAESLITIGFSVRVR